VPRQPLTRRDWLFVAVCVLLGGIAIVIIQRYFSAAFPEASIDFRYDRGSSAAIAEQVLTRQSLRTAGMKHAVRFDTDDGARIFLERSLGLAQATKVMHDDVDVWSWHHRWFRPLVEEEVSVDVAPDGDVIAFMHVLPEERAIGSPVMAGAQGIAERFLRDVDAGELTLVAQSERRLPRRMQRIFTYEANGIRPAGAPYRHIVTVDGNVVSSYERTLKIPDAWLRSYRELRSKNSAAGAIDMVLMVATMIAAVVIFIIRLWRGQLSLRFLLTVAIASVVLVALKTVNEVPSELAYYDTTSSYAAFLGGIILRAALECVGTAMLLVVVCGAGEVLYRQRLPQHLAIPRLWSRRALTSKRVFRSLVLGYTLVPLFIAYQTVFYLVAARFGAWAPAEVRYDELLNTALPWAAVLFAGFFPALSEEFLSRAFSIPLLQRILHSRLAAIVLAAFIWGFGHSTYPNQPFWIRGVEVGIVGIVMGLLMDRFGLVALLIWHYTVDAVYTSVLLLGSGNAYYVATAAAASLLFVIPLVASIALYIRNRGFLDDDDLTNAAMPVTAEAEPEPEAVPEHVEKPELPPVPLVTRKRVLLCAAVVIAAVIAIALQPSSPEDVIDYRIDGAEAKVLAMAHVRNVARQRVPARIISIPNEGFRSWNADSSREEGGSPGDFDGIAASYLLQHGLTTDGLLRIWRERIEAATYTVRFFTPMQKDELFVELDPRTRRVVGYHKYQDEQNPGASLDEPAALAIAQGAFASYGVDVRTFAVAEALSFQQPHRRDWLFHFQERTPLAASAFRRVTVRVAGAEVTQFAKHIKVPESVYREAGTQTLLNIIFFGLQLLGMIALLAMVVAGMVMVARHHGLPWRRALKWTLLLAIIPIAGVVLHYESMLFSYSTSIAWETFRIRLATEVVQRVALQLGILFLAFAGIEAAMPQAYTVLTREGRARLGRSAVIAALTALGIVIVAATAMQALERAFPAATTVSLSVPMEVQTPLPALFESAQALLAAVVVSAAAALYASSMPRRAALVMAISVAALTINPSATPPQVPLMLLRTVGIGVVAWVVARHVLGRNPLAWPLTVFLAICLQTAGTLLQNHRPDLVINGVALLVIAALAATWTATSLSSRA
jgi:membrane protease YdiL (CAAX protease family)